MILGVIEVGGIKFVCGIGIENGEVFEWVSFFIMILEEMMVQVIVFFEGKEIEVLGVGFFGLIDLIEGSFMYGYIIIILKFYWGQYDIIGKFKEYFDVLMMFDMDVNGVVFGEVIWGVV